MRAFSGIHFRPRVVIRLFTILLILTVVSFVGYGNVFASDNISIGYFGKTHVPGEGAEATVVLPAYSGYGEALPGAVINSKQSLYEFLVNTNLSTDAQKRTGSAYIVCTMLGQVSAADCASNGYIDANRTVVYPTAWDILHSRLVDNADVVLNSIDVSYASAFRNTMWDPEENDVFSYDKYGTTTRATIALSNAAGTIDYYRIFRACANPLGGLGGLPASPWHAEPIVQVNILGQPAGPEIGSNGDYPPVNVAVGQLVQWNNIVKFTNGSGAILYSGEKSGAWGGSTGPISISGDVGVNHFTYTIQASDAGKTYCSWTAISNSSPGGPAAASKSACVYIAPNWNITATSTINKTTAAPGDRIIWTHNLKNDGPSNTTDRIYSRLNINGISEWNGSDMAGAYTEGGQGIGVIRHITDYSIYDVTQDEVGKDLCEQILFQRIDNGSYGSGNEVCVNIPYSYTLTPIVSINPKDVVEDGSSFTVTSSIKNDGATKSKPSNWSLTETVKYPNGSTRSTTNVGGAGNVIFDQNSPKIVATLTPAASGEAGTKYCYRLAVYPRSGVDDSEVSTETCITIGKKPKVQIIGGNLSAGGLVNTSTSVKNSRMFGSWTEYGVFAVKDISGMASGSAFASNNGLAGYSVCNYSTLSFTNVKTGASTCSGNTGTIGNYVGANTASNVAASFPGGNTINDSSVNANNLVSGSGVYIGSKSGDLTLSSSTLSAGKSVILKVSGTVTIADNQYYENKTYMNATDLPQLIIIANNINILDSVTNIDAWLIANNGNINTCSNFSGVLTTDKCSQKLTINGPVSSKKLFLNRTAGSGTGVNSGDPAEVFNLRADVYLWAAAYAKLNNKIQSVYTTELPPRF